MGANVTYQDQNFIIETQDGLVGTEIFFPIQSVGATETIMMTAVLARGKTVLKNCALEPEIISLGEFLISNGAKIQGLGTTTIIIEGGTLLKPKNFSETIPDRIEAGSYMILGALCGKNVDIKRINKEHLDSLTQLLIQSGVKIVFKPNGALWDCNIKGQKDLKSFNVRTHEYPGFPTDLQAPIVTYLSLASGTSSVLETIYESRFKYVDDLVSMGAKIEKKNSREISVSGVSSLHANKKPIEVKDIRAGFAILLASLCATGETTLDNVRLIDRGYENIIDKLTKIGAKIERRC
jgi:UDP-N-acetylglucosamine 1-carboxyvinyltransferase